MKTILSLLTLATFAIATADDHGGIHIHTNEGEEIEDDSCKAPSFCMEMRPWYDHLWYSDYENIEEQADRLQDETAFPSQRENYSDFLLR
jgi:hypothetical protein